MVRAILDGRKTQTRRVVKLPRWIVDRGGSLDHARPNGSTLAVPIEDDTVAHVNSPYRFEGDPVVGGRGARLWVRESWAIGLAALPTGEGFVPFTGSLGEHRTGLAPSTAPRAKLVYRASWDGPDVPPMRPSIHMPRWASRITLEITKLRVERLQDITNTDAVAEGCQGGLDVAGYSERNPAEPYEGYAALWDSLNARRGYGWDVNPWVWVIEFAKVNA
jgi:hypothetical protein